MSITFNGPIGCLEIATEAQEFDYPVVLKHAKCSTNDARIIRTKRREPPDPVDLYQFVKNANLGNAADLAQSSKVEYPHKDGLIPAPLLPQIPDPGLRADRKGVDQSDTNLSAGAEDPVCPAQLVALLDISRHLRALLRHALRPPQRNSDGDRLNIRLPVTPHSLFLLLLCGLLWSTEARNVLAEEMDKESKPLVKRIPFSGPFPNTLFVYCYSST
ncbi:unnamed protein product [Soboliphyme baturini]|uniref:Mago-bind domain-containing protein n=1 Tax=Soboliphyme baturini TaxID=241478 RepID=A0A183J0P0_9BILA|nr:unnamed protein product [Soboliphyme baturini]